MQKINVFWFRRDLRLHDNCGLYHALNSGLPVLAFFLFDKNILDDIEEKNDARLSFLHQELSSINQQLISKGSKLLTYYESPQNAFKNLIEAYSIQNIFTNKDYEPYAIKRDLKIKAFLKKNGIPFFSYKDQVIFEENEIVKADGSPYLVYTPYSKKWLSSVTNEMLAPFKSGLDFENWFKTAASKIIPLNTLGFENSEVNIPSKSIANETLHLYESERNYPAKDSTSKLGVHLRFGTLSIRDLYRKSEKLSAVYFKELIWREFFMMILFHFPHVVENNFNPKYDNIRWRNNEEEFVRWTKGETGYPLVDAGMRELNETGFMHNRVRMVVASFLTKHLLIDWKWGEAYFAQKLLDYELASNNGNWQWCAGTGVDASPYFRIFNPTTQLEKFDKNHIYIKRWVKNVNSSTYPKPMIEHKTARKRAIQAYKESFNL